MFVFCFSAIIKKHYKKLINEPVKPGEIMKLKNSHYVAKGSHTVSHCK